MVGFYAVLHGLTMVAGTLLLLVFFAATLVPVLELRDHFEPFGPYQVARSATLGGFLQVLGYMIAVGVLHHATPPAWMGYPFQIGAGVLGIVASVLWLKKDPPKQRGDRYYIKYVVPIQVFLALTLFTFVFVEGLMSEKVTTAGVLCLFFYLFRVDQIEGRLEQDKYIEKQLEKNGWSKKV